MLIVWKGRKLEQRRIVCVKCKRECTVLQCVVCLDGKVRCFNCRVEVDRNKRPAIKKKTGG